MVTSISSSKSVSDFSFVTDGFEFIEFTGPQEKPLTGCLHSLFISLGFVPIGVHNSKQITLYHQGKINFILNSEAESYAHHFYQGHGVSLNAFAIRVTDASAALQKALSFGAEEHEPLLNSDKCYIPAIRTAGGTLLYLMEPKLEKTFYSLEFDLFPEAQKQINNFTQRNYGYFQGVGLKTIDHITYNVSRGEMDRWCDFYKQVFDFKEVQYFNIKGKQTGLVSRALISPCGKIRIPINESTDDDSQIEEFLQVYNGAGVQHVALESADIYGTVKSLKENGIKFLTTPETYYHNLHERIPDHGEPKNKLKELNIQVDGHKDSLLLQIFTETYIGPIFFEIIQRKGNEGFGQGNFQALFERMEQDQINRGVL